MLLYNWFFFLIIKYIYKCPTTNLKKIIKYILNMGGSSLAGL